MEEIETACYLRLHAVDRPGVLARVASILSEQGISIEAIIQKEATEGELVPIILLTHRARELHMNEAIRQLEALVDVAGSVVRIRVEDLDDNA
jgi:homoserine dehydrogenase